MTLSTHLFKDLEKANQEIESLSRDNKCLLEAAKEMFEFLLRKPDGPLWPSEEELSRYCFQWKQLISQVEMGKGYQP